MVDSNTIKKLYDTVIQSSDDKLTSKELISCGFNYHDLDKLIARGTIVRVERGVYSFRAVDDLFHYGKELISKDLFKKSYLCLEKCYELDPNNLEVCFQLFDKHISDDNFEEAFKYLDKLMETDNKYYQIDYDYYLYLLNFITEIPDKYQQYVKYLTYDYIKIPKDDKRYENINNQNIIRKWAIAKNFSYALQLQNDLLAETKYNTVQNMLIKKILKKVVISQNELADNLLKLIQEGNYSEIIKVLEEQDKRCGITIVQEQLLYLAKQILYISSARVIPEKSPMHENTYFEAIKTNNYDEALRIYSKYSAEKSIYTDYYHYDTDNDKIVLLLTEISKLIEDISKSTELTDDREIEVLGTEAEISSEKDSSSVLSLIINDLVNDNIDEAFIKLTEYMRSINREEYEFLIVDLIKISLLQGDKTFEVPINTLSLMNMEDYNIELFDYIKGFYEALGQEEMAIADIYLDILKKGSNLNQNPTVGKRLEDILAICEDIYDDKIEAASLKEEVTSQGVEKDTESDDIKEFIDEMHSRLMIDRGIILLDPMTREQRKQIHILVREYNDMTSFSVGEDSNRRVVLRKKSGFLPEYNLKEEENLARDLYVSGRYDQCIEKNLDILGHLKMPNSYIFAKLGMAYLKNGNLEQAITYLEVADALNKENNLSYDYSSLIKAIKDKNNGEKDVGLDMNKEDFSSGEDENENELFNMVNDLVSLTGLDVESAGFQLGLNLGQINTVKLLYAKEFFRQGMSEKGEQFLKSFTISHNKTQENKELFDEIVKNKKLYPKQGIKSKDSKKLSNKIVP